MLALLAAVGVGAMQSVAAAASPTLSAYASSGWWAGSPIYDSVNLNNGLNPTGTLTFRLYGTGDTACAAPIFTTRNTVTGNGYYTSASYTTNMVGNYRWTVHYSGDGNNSPAATVCGDPNQELWVAKRPISLVAVASEMSSNGTATNTATLSRGVGPAGPTGTLTFNVYGPGNTQCAGTPVFSATEQVTGNGTYVSDAFRPTVTGKHQWVISYSGDANNTAGYTTCGDTDNDLMATISTPPTAFTVTASSGRPGGTVAVSWTGLPNPTASDWIGLYRVGAPGWSVTSWSYARTASGNLNLAVPANAAPGSYEVRLRTAKSGVVTIA